MPLIFMSHSYVYISFCILTFRQFLPGLASFKKVIDRESARLGQTHFQLIEKYANAGYCALNTRDGKLAETYLSQALAAIDANPSAHLQQLEKDIRESLRGISSSPGKKTASTKHYK